MGHPQVSAISQDEIRLAEAGLVECAVVPWPGDAWSPGPNAHSMDGIGMGSRGADRCCQCQPKTSQLSGERFFWDLNM